MSDFYSRVASASLKKETTVNTPVVPDTFFSLNDEDISAEYPYTSATPVKNNRAINIKAVKNGIPAPSGSVNVNIEPKNWGHFINGVYGGVSSGNYMPISSASASFSVGETVTGGTSTETAVVSLDSDSEYLILTSASGEFTDAETITGGTSGSTATVTEFDTTVFGHAGTMPSANTVSYTLQVNYVDNAIRYIGTRFTGIDSVAQSENIITAGVQIMAQGQFRHAKVTAVTTAAAGSNTITVDQTYGIIATDSIKLYRPGTGFLDFSASNVKIHTIDSITNTTSFVVTNLETSTAVGDLIMLAPQTASYTVGNEFSWIGGSHGDIGAAVGSLSTDCLEDFTYVVSSEFESRHCATGADFEDLFPNALVQKGFTASGNFVISYQDEDFYRSLRLNTLQAFRIRSIGDLIGSTGMENECHFTFPSVQFDTYQTNVGNDDIVKEDIPFTAFDDSTTGYSSRALLINDVASY